MKNAIFVYGTLKKGYVNHEYMFKSKFIKEIILPKKGFLFENKNRYFPHLMLNDDGNDIKGELYEISDNALLFLDKLEGHPDFFERISLGKYEEYENLFVYEYIFQKKDKMSDFNIIKEF